MQIIVKEEAYTYMYDSSVYDKTDENGVVNPCFPKVDEAVDAALSLLGIIYGREKVANAIKEGVPAMEYATID